MHFTLSNQKPPVRDAAGYAGGWSWRRMRCGGRAGSATMRCRCRLRVPGRGLVTFSAQHHQLVMFRGFVSVSERSLT